MLAKCSEANQLLAIRWHLQTEEKTVGLYHFHKIRLLFCSRLALGLTSTGQEQHKTGIKVLKQTVELYKAISYLVLK